MKEKKLDIFINKRPFIFVLLVFLLCCVFRVIEYFLIRTDQFTDLGEAVFHKIIGIIILCLLVMWLTSFTFEEIGFTKNKFFINILKGFVFGLIVFFVAYSVELIIVAIQGKFKALEFYVSSYAVDGNVGRETKFVFFLICFLGNVINVVMEEGIFRGLFQKILEKKYSFIVSAVISSLLFGVWHIVAPIRNYVDGTSSLPGMFVNIAILVSTSSLIGFKFAMLTKMTGNLYMAMADHFVNNTIVNILHVTSTTGSDELQTVRISIAQSVSFIVVLIFYILYVRKLKQQQLQSKTDNNTVIENK